jgi:broad specificity phosphatase PhoE
MLFVMVRLYLVRHGNATTTWEPGDWDPGLTELGRAQAEARAEQLANLNLGPLAILSSPLRRTRETAAALERKWKTVAVVEPRISEIRADGIAPEKRRDWLRAILQRRWGELGLPLDRWRNDVREALLGIAQDTVVFTHSVAINVAVGFALGDDRVTCFRPANCSCSLLEVEGGQLRVVELGEEDAVGGKIG